MMNSPWAMLRTPSSPKITASPRTSRARVVTPYTTFSAWVTIRGSMVREGSRRFVDLFGRRPEERGPLRAASLEGRPQWKRSRFWPSFETHARLRACAPQDEVRGSHPPYTKLPFAGLAMLHAFDRLDDLELGALTARDVHG